MLQTLVHCYLPVLESLLSASAFLHGSRLYARTADGVRDRDCAASSGVADRGDDALLAGLDDALAEPAAAPIEVLELVGPTASWTPVGLVPEEPYRSEPEQSRMFLRTPRGDWPLYPMFASERDIADASSEPVMLFDGHSRLRVLYLGVSTMVDSSEAIKFYERKLAAKRMDLRVSAAQVGPETLATSARFWTEERLSELRGSKYFPNLAVSRAGAEGLVDRFLAQSAKPALLLSGAAGAGKTTLSCRVADRLLAGESTVAADPSADLGRAASRSFAVPLVLLLPGHGFRLPEVGTPDPFRVIARALWLAAVPVWPTRSTTCAITRRRRRASTVRSSCWSAAGAGGAWRCC